MSATNPELRPIVNRLLSEVPPKYLEKYTTVEEKLRARAQFLNLEFEFDAFDVENPDNWDGDQMYGFKV